MAVEAARLALRGRDRCPSQLLFATTSRPTRTAPTPPAIHAALQLPSTAAAFDIGASVRSAVGGLLLALNGGTEPALVVGADVRTGLPGSGEEATSGTPPPRSSSATTRTGQWSPSSSVPASVTDEFVERWRAPGELRTRVWDEQFSEIADVPLGVSAWNAALESTGLTAGDVAAAAVVAPAQRVARSVGGKLDGVHVIDDLSATVGNTGAAQPGLLLAALLEQAEPGQVVALVVLADGADVLLFRTTDALGSYRPARTIATRSPRADRCPTASSSRGGACCRSSRRAAPNRSGSRRRPQPAARNGSSASSVRRNVTRESYTCRRHGCRAMASTPTRWSRSRWPTRRARS